MKIALLGDIHFGVYNSDEDFFTYQIKILDKIFDELRSKGINIVILLGDFFDNRKILQLKHAHDVKEYIKSKTDYFNFIYISGNHDLAFKNDNSVNSVKLLFEDVKNFRIINDTAEELLFGNTKFLMIPWLNENSEESFKEIMKTDAMFACGHLELKGFEWVKGIESTEGLEIDLFGRFTRVFTGHFHIASEKANIKYIGSCMQLSYNDFDVKKIYTVFDTDVNTWEDIEIGNYIFEKIYNISEVNPKDYAGKFVKIYITDVTDETEMKIKEISDVAIKTEVFNISEESENIEEEIQEVSEEISERNLISNMIFMMKDYDDIAEDIFKEISILKAEVE